MLLHNNNPDQFWPGLFVDQIVAYQIYADTPPTFQPAHAIYLSAAF